MDTVFDLARDLAHAARFAGELVRRSNRLALAALRDAIRPRRALMAENAALRAQLATLRRKAGRITPDAADRVLLVATSQFVPDWRGVLQIVRPETLVRWHRDVARWLWAWRSRPKGPRRPPGRTPDEVRTLVIDMATTNPRWGPLRISGELGKIGITLHERTVARILAATWPRGRPRGGRGQTWKTFVRNHLPGTWACDFLTVTTLTFKQVHAFVMLDLATRRIVHANVTAHPTGEWTTQQLRNAVWDGGPRRLIRDRDAKFTRSFDAIVENDGGEVLLTPPRCPVANAFAERLVGSARREVFDHLVPRDEDHARAALLEWVRHYNAGRPHQGIDQQVPGLVGVPAEQPMDRRVVRRAVLNGLIHEYSLAA